MGVTTAELGKMMERGELTAEMLLPGLSEELLKMANAGGQLAEAMNNTNSAVNRFRTNVFLANATFNQAGFDETIRNLFNTMSSAIERAEPLWQLLGQTTKFVGQALEAPIELFGTIAESLGYFTDETGKANAQAKLFAAGILLVSQRARKLFAIFWLIPAAISAINDLIQNGPDGFGSLALQIGTVTAAAVIFRKEIGTILSILKKIGKFSLPGTVAGSAGAGAATGGALAGALRAATIAGGGASAMLYSSKLGGNGADYFENGQQRPPAFNPNQDSGRVFDMLNDKNLAAWMAQQNSTTNNNLNGNITIEINGAQDNQGIKEDVLDTINNLFRNASNSNPYVER